MKRATIIAREAVAIGLVLALAAAFARVALGDVILATPTPGATKVAPRLIISEVNLHYAEKLQIVVYRIYGTDGVLVGEYRQTAPLSATPPAYATSAKLAFERALAGSTPIPGISPAGKGSVTP